MPGIAGVISLRPNPANRLAVEGMVKLMVHEPFYRSGLYANESLGLCAGWTAHRGSFSDLAPVWNKTKDVCLIFSGEDLGRGESNGQERSRNGHDDGAWLVREYEEKGQDFLVDINGDFAGLVIDLRQNKVLLFNDRYGLHRIYFHENDHGFWFASEAKPVLKIAPATRTFDVQSLGEFLSCGCVLQNRTLFSGISLLPGGSVWTFQPGRPPVQERYFEPLSWERQPLLRPSEFYREVKNTWQRIVPRYFQGDTSMALSLTGGLDSRMILAWVPTDTGKLPCYTFGGMYRDCADVIISRRVAQICQHEHRTIRVNGDFLEQFPALAEQTVSMTGGTMDVTGAADLHIQRLGRQIAPVRVTGTNGGELLRNIVAFKPSPICPDLFDRQLRAAIDQAATTWHTEAQERALTFTAFKQAPWFMAPKFGLERSEVTLRMPYFDNELVSLLYRAPAECMTPELSLRLIEEGNPELARIATDRAATPDTNPMAAKAFQAYQHFTYKAEYAWDYGMPQWLAKFDRALKPLHMEKLFLGRHKFTHFRVWYQNQLADYVRSILLDSRTLGRPYLQRARVQEIVNDHTRGVGNFTRELHKLLTLELIERTLLQLN
jgi:asparagine synthase (glutamine-hydrolysing)